METRGIFCKQLCLCVCAHPLDFLPRTTYQDSFLSNLAHNEAVQTTATTKVPWKNPKQGKPAALRRPPVEPWLQGRGGRERLVRGCSFQLYSEYVSGTLCAAGCHSQYYGITRWGRRSSQVWPNPFALNRLPSLKEKLTLHSTTLWSDSQVT